MGTCWRPQALPGVLPPEDAPERSPSLSVFGSPGRRNSVSWGRGMFEVEVEVEVKIPER